MNQTRIEIKQPRRKKKQTKPKRGRPKATNVSVTPITQTKIQVTFPEEVIRRLLELHDEKHMFKYDTPREHRWAEMRIEFARLGDLGMPAVFVRFEAPSFNPRGYRLRRVGVRYIVRLNPTKIGLRHDLKTRRPEHMWFDIDPNILGLGLIFDDADMLSPGEATRLTGQRDSLSVLAHDMLWRAPMPFGGPPK